MSSQTQQTAMAQGEFLKDHAKEKKKFYRLLTIFFCIDLLIIGLAAIIASALIIQHYKSYLDFADTKYLGAVVFCLIIGLVILGVGILGLYGTVNEKVASIRSFFILVLVLLFMNIIAGSLCLAYRGKVDKAVDVSLNKGIKRYYSHEKDRHFFDWLHKEYDCCGLQGPGDWGTSNKSHAKTSARPHISTSVAPKPTTNKTKTVAPKSTVNATNQRSTAAPSTAAPTTGATTINHFVVNAPPPKHAGRLTGGGIPKSCCVKKTHAADCGGKKNTYHKGCKHDFENLIHYLLGVVGTIAFACAIIELLGACVTYVFLKGVAADIYETI